jgi:hypothetical protein
VIGETSPCLANKQTITITHKIPQGFKIKERVDNSDKGVSLDQVEFEEKQTPFEMS